MTVNSTISFGFVCLLSSRVTVPSPEQTKLTALKYTELLSIQTDIVRLQIMRSIKNSVIISQKETYKIKAGSVC